MVLLRACLAVGNLRISGIALSCFFTAARPGRRAWQADMESMHGKAETIIGKQRHGPTGTVQLQFQADVTRFANLADEKRLPEVPL